MLISDYDKGVCTPGLLAPTIAAAKARGIRVIADPIRGGDYRKYHGCSAMTPNRLEAGLATGRTISTNDEALAAAAEAARRSRPRSRHRHARQGRHGPGPSRRPDGIFPTRPRQVYDITGAGDMVMSVLGLALAAGADYDPAIRLANIAGGLEVEKIGVATVTRDEILADLFHTPLADPQAATSKLRTLPRLLPELEARRRAGQRIAFTNGCFDVLHAGHVQYLTEARPKRIVWWLGLNADASVQKLKGPGRPVNSEDARAAVLAASRPWIISCSSTTRRRSS